MAKSMKPNERIIVALDVPNASQARSVVAELGKHVGAFKIGLELFAAEGPAFVKSLTESGIRVFLDLKLHDIPNTVARAAGELVKLDVWMLNVHALGGKEMMMRTKSEVETVCADGKYRKPILIAVTILTSSDSTTLAATGIDPDVDREVLRLADLANGSGFDGVVASPLETGSIRSRNGDGFVIVTPGVRPFADPGTNETSDDQKRVMTPGRAVAAGSDYLVIGRPILNAPDRVRAVTEIQAQIAQIR